MLYIIIPIFNRIEYTKGCLLSLYKQTYKNFKIVVINDGSTDGSGKVLERDFPSVHVINGDGNLWWTAATNLGVKFALKNGADYILTLNNDTIATPDFLEKMMYWAEKKPNSLLGAFAIDAETRDPDYGGEIIDWKKAKAYKVLETLHLDDRVGLKPVTHFPGRGLLIPSFVFKEIGYYDQFWLPHYAADYDFTHRALKSGFSIYCNYDAKLLVFPAASGDKDLRNNKNFGNYLKHLFSIKGGGNIKYFTIYTFKNCPVKNIPFFLIKGIITRIFGYWRKNENNKN